MFQLSLAVSFSFIQALFLFIWLHEVLAVAYGI